MHMDTAPAHGHRRKSGSPVRPRGKEQALQCQGLTWKLTEALLAEWGQKGRKFKDHEDG